MKAMLGLAMLLAASTAAAADDAATTYQRMHQAILGPFNPPNVIQYLHAPSRALLDRDGQAGAKFVVDMGFMKDDMPRAYTVTSSTPGGGGATHQLKLTGTGKRFDRPVPMDGTVDLVLEGSVWKVRSVTWGKRKIP